MTLRQELEQEQAMLRLQIKLRRNEIEWDPGIAKLILENQILRKALAELK